jgi:hypothetical protein
MEGKKGHCPTQPNHYPRYISFCVNAIYTHVCGVFFMDPRYQESNVHPKGAALERKQITITRVT